MKSIALWVFGSIYITYKYSIAPFPVIFTLRDTGVHVGVTNSNDVTANVEISIDKHFCIQAILRISDISSYDYYVQF